MYERFGAHVEDHQVELRLFVPDSAVDPAQYLRGGLPRIREIRVRGDFQSRLGGSNWELQSAPVMERREHPNGWLYVCRLPGGLPDGYYQYKYFVTFENDTRRWVTDPCSKYGGSDEWENAAFVIGGNDRAVSPIARRLPLRDLVIYELMIDDFTAEYRGDRAPIDAVHDRLPYLERLGINAIEFMPWTAWPGGGFSWGYDPVQFFSVEYRYVHDPAEPLDKLFRLKSLISALHARGLHVVMDGVFNHVRAGSSPDRGFPYYWLYQDPADSPYIGPFERGGFFEEFDYRNGCVREFIRDVCLYWLDEYQIDGIRFDFTLGFYREGDESVGISALIADVRQHLAAQGRENVSLILEHLTDNRYEAIEDTNRIEASGCWLDPFMYESWHAARTGRPDGQLLRVLNAGLDFEEKKSPVIYIENHDHSQVAREVGGRELWYKTQAPAIALLTSPGAVMLHNGQEFGDDYFLPGSGDDRVLPRPLRWEERSRDFVGKRLYELYRRLIELRTEHPALRSDNVFPYPFNHPDGYGVYPDLGAVIYHRWGRADDGDTERFVIVLNYSETDRWLRIPFSEDGLWQDLLNGESVWVEGYALSSERVNSHWGRVYWRKQQGTG
jgi:1,4-alpha-glucan branching enzyme